MGNMNQCIIVSEEQRIHNAWNALWIQLSEAEI